MVSAEERKKEEKKKDWVPVTLVYEKHHVKRCFKEQLYSGTGRV